MAKCYIKFTADTPYCGTESIVYMEFDEKPSAQWLDEQATEMANENAGSYEYLVTGWNDDMFDDEEERDAALEDYYASCGCEWEEVTEEEYLENS